MRPKLKIYQESGIPEPKVQTGAEWFEAQDDATKRKMMGIAAHGLYKQGRIKLSDFEGMKHDQKWGDQSYQRSLREIARNG